MKINVLGTGYVGLVSGVCLAAEGHQVKCFDTNIETINILNKGKCHFYENGLENLLAEFNSNITFRLLDLSSKSELIDSDVILIAVGTPTIDDKIHLGQIETACKTIGSLIKNSDKFISVIIKSTVVPGTTDTFVKNILESTSGKLIGDFGLGMNPEFLREGNAVQDFMNPDRIVFGFEDEKTLDILKEMYKPWNTDKVEVNTRSAEMIKYVNNSLLATQISTINEYSNIARAIGNINFNKVMKGVHLDHRWSPIINNSRVRPQIIDYLLPGVGFGGSCFPKDVKAISALAKKKGVNPIILDSVIKVNHNQPKQIINFLKNKVGNLNNKNILLLGLSFKPETDDVRESVSIKLIENLSNESCNISVHDPISTKNAKKAINVKSKVYFLKNWRDKLIENDIIIIATNWKEYKDLNKYDDILENKFLLDTRSLLNKNDFKKTNYLNINN